MMLCVLLAAVLLYGCGSSNKEGSASGTPDTVASVGDALCRQCHSAVLDPLTKEGIVAQYDATSPHRDSPHANNGNGCEACHGGGGQHNGVGPIPYPDPYADNGVRCASCHTGNYATNAPTKFAGSKHANMVIEEGSSCRRCHTHEGGVLGAFYGLTGTKDVMDNPAYQGAVPLAKEYTTFECATCHQHGAGLRTVLARNASGDVVNWNPSRSNKANDQFNLCTSCHGLKTFDGSKIMASGTAASGTATVGHHETSWYRIIATTHYNNADNATNGISGYVLRMPTEANPNATPCFDCHGHEARTETSNNPNQTTYVPSKTTIYRDWAMSGHGGGLLSAKYDAAGSNPRTVEQVDLVMNAAVKTEPWWHYDWSGADRQACQRCHTATGAANFLNNPATYNPANNNFSHLAGWTISSKSSKQREMLYCWGCHSNRNVGTLRNPGALTLTFTNDTVVSYPDVGNSNVCVACHSGRETGDSIKNFPPATDFSNRSFVNSHYLSAGGTVFSKTGYTYGSRNYNSTPDGFVHDKLGVSATGIAAADTYIADNNLDKSGPCAVCHLTSEKQGGKSSHAFSPFTEYAAGDVALNPVCVTCHSTRGAGSNAKVTWFEGTWRLRANAALDALKVQLSLRGFNFTPVHPYFANKDWLSAGDTDKTGNTTGKHNMGSAFNYNLLVHDPGAVAHNRYYTRRLIYDSIDWIDDNILNYSVGTTLSALNPDTAPYKADAITFLIKGGVPTGTAAERY
jgi:hypothetical protein